MPVATRGGIAILRAETVEHVRRRNAVSERRFTRVAKLIPARETACTVDHARRVVYIPDLVKKTLGLATYSVPASSAVLRTGATWSAFAFLAEFITARDRG